MSRPVAPPPFRTDPDGTWWWAGQAVLFDLDSTLVESAPSGERAWRALAASIGEPYETFARYAHGIPAPQAFAMALPGSSEADVARWSAALLDHQIGDSDDVVPLPDAAEALDALATSRWAIVTSGDVRLATTRIRAAGLPLPRVLVTAEDVITGKPHPAPFLLGATRLGVPPETCLVVEDAWAGVEAGNAAGMTTLGLLTTSASLTDADHAVPDLSWVTVDADRAGVRVEARP